MSTASRQLFHLFKKSNSDPRESISKTKRIKHFRPVWSGSLSLGVHEPSPCAALWRRAARWQSERVIRLGTVTLRDSRPAYEANTLRRRNEKLVNYIFSVRLTIMT